MPNPFSRLAALAIVVASLSAASCLQAQTRHDGQAPAAPAQPILKPGDVLAIVGDSITEQKIYSVDMEAYLAACTPLHVRVVQCGWGGDSTGWFLGRHSDLGVGAFHPTVATTCFGMNDGQYRAPDPQVIKTYHDGMVKLVQALQAQGVQRFVIGSPGAVDPKTFQRSGPNASPDAADVYNPTLGDLADEARKVALQFSMPYADLHAPFLDIIKRAEAHYGEKYDVAGGDGVHPNDNGHLVMAWAFLKGLGLDGDIGTITLDAAAGSATATAGHTVDSATATSVVLTSTRYPFCFYGDPSKPDATTGIIDFFPFNQELNRFTLVVKGLKAPKAKVTFGESSKEFTADQLAKGINLAAEFLDNPFNGPFKRVLNAAKRKQEIETGYYKSLLPSLLDLRGQAKADGPDAEAALARVQALAMQRDAALAAAVQAAVVPVKYTITVEPVTE